MLAHQQRVVDEKKALDFQMAKLGVFLGTTTFSALPGEDKDLLVEQHGLMAKFSAVLGKRIARFGGAT